MRDQSSIGRIDFNGSATHIPLRFLPLIVGKRTEVSDYLFARGHAAGAGFEAKLEICPDNTVELLRLGPCGDWVDTPGGDQLTARRRKPDACNAVLGALPIRERRTELARGDRGRHRLLQEQQSVLLDGRHQVLLVHFLATRLARQ